MKLCVCLSHGTDAGPIIREMKAQCSSEGDTKHKATLKSPLATLAHSAQHIIAVNAQVLSTVCPPMDVGRARADDVADDESTD